MQVPILLGIQVGYSKNREFAAAELEALLRQLKNDAPMIGGMEIRFGGTSSSPSGRISGNSLRDIIKVCQLTEMYEYSCSVLHLSKLGLDICKGNYSADELRSAGSILGARKINKSTFSEYFLQLWDFVVGHYGEHDGAFNSILSTERYKKQKKQIMKDGHLKGSKHKHVRQALELEQGDPLLENKLLPENGYLPFNCLPNIAIVAAEMAKQITLDIGHVTKGLFGYCAPHDIYEEIKKHSKNNPLIIGSIDKADKLDLYYDKHRREFRTTQLEEWGALARHVHFHGCIPVEEPRVVYGTSREPVYIMKDHSPLTRSTLLGELQFGIIKRLLNGSRNSIKSATLELEKPHLFSAAGSLNFDNINTSIETFMGLLNN